MSQNREFRGRLMEFIDDYFVDYYFTLGVQHEEFVHIYPHPLAFTDYVVRAMTHIDKHGCRYFTNYNIVNSVSILTYTACLYQRFIELTQEKITNDNIYGIFCALYILSYKMLIDFPHWNNTYLAKIFGISKKNIRKYEKSMLQILDYSLLVDTAQFDSMLQKIYIIVVGCESPQPESDLVYSDSE